LGNEGKGKIRLEGETQGRSSELGKAVSKASFWTARAVVEPARVTRGHENEGKSIAGSSASSGGDEKGNDLKVAEKTRSKLNGGRKSRTTGETHV